MSIDFTYATFDQEEYQTKKWNEATSKVNQALYDRASEKHNGFLSATIKAFGEIEGLFPLFRFDSEKTKFEGY